MKKPHILKVNFSDKENNLIVTALAKKNIYVTQSACLISQLGTPEIPTAEVNLIVLKLTLGHSPKVNEAHITQVKRQFVHIPIIIVTDIPCHDEVYQAPSRANIIDIRPLLPISFVAISIARELKSQRNKFLYKQVNSQLENTQYRLDAIVKHTEDGIALVHQGLYHSSNEAYKRIFKIPLEENIINLPVLEFNSLTHPADGQHSAKKQLNTSLEALPNETVLSVLIQTRENESFVTTIYKTHCVVNELMCTQIIIHNPSAWSNIDKGFTDLRTFDHETGLYNKRFTLESIDKTLHSPKPFGTLAVILIENFRHIREQHTLDYIDLIIHSAAKVIKASFLDTDIIARYGDALFTVYSDQLSLTDFSTRCEHALNQVNNTLFGDETQYINLSLSIGVSFIGERTLSTGQLLNQADKACDKASQLGGGQIYVYDSVVTPLAIIDNEDTHAKIIRSAIQEDRLQSLYQPIVDLSEDSIENYAVLLRIIDKDRSHIPPDNFILTAERAGLIDQLDLWVLINTIKQIKEASQRGIKRRFFINLSHLTYHNDTFIESLVKEIAAYNIDPSLLVFQLNYSAVKTDPIRLKNFTSVLKDECGCQIAFDQIGFSHVTSPVLKEYSVDYLKIDGTFSQNLLHNKGSQQTIENIIKLARHHQIKTIAKSVEDANTLALLWNLGIDAVQGYFLQKPSDNMRFDFDLNN